MRIALVTEVWHPTVNGVVTRLAATVDELLAAGHQVLVIAPGRDLCDSEDGDLTVRGVPTVSVPWVYGGQAWGRPCRRVGRLLAAYRPDVVHVASPASLGIAAVISARHQRLPLVCSYHTDLAAYAGFYRLGWLRPVIRRAMRAVHRRADVNLVTSGTAAAQLAAIGLAGARMWAQGVDLDRFHPPATRSRRPLTALYVGRLAAEKRVEALAHLGALIGLKVVVVGDGPARPEIEAALAGLDAEFRGTLEGEALARAYREADVFVFPSETDTLGLVLLEAMASGLPVVAAESPASREVLGSSPATRRWDPARPEQLPVVVTELLGSARRETLQLQARAQVEGVSWTRATAGLVTTYKAARASSRLSGRGQRRPRRLGRFAAVGATNVAIDIGVFNVLAAIGPTHAPTQLAFYNTIAVSLALVNSYAWNSRWTFTPRDGCEWRWSAWHRRALFVAQGLMNLAVNDAAVVVAAILLERAGALSAVAVANGSKVVGMVAASLVSYAFMRGVVFRNRKRRSGSPAPSAEGARRPQVVSG